MGNTPTTLPANADHEDDQIQNKKKRQYEDIAAEDASSSSSPASPTSDSASKKQRTATSGPDQAPLVPSRVFCFTGFKKSNNNNNNSIYTNEAQKQLIAMLTTAVSSSQITPAAQVLNIKLAADATSKSAEADLSRITHVIAPPLARTPTILLAALAGKWILPPEYLHACIKQGRWIEESNYGFRLQIVSNTGNTSVFLKPNSTKVYIASSFDKTYDTNASQQCKLVLQYAHIATVSQISDADVILVGSRDKCTSAQEQESIESQSLQKIYTLERFMEMIYPQYCASSVKHAADKYQKSVAAAAQQ